MLDGGPAIEFYFKEGYPRFWASDTATNNALTSGISIYNTKIYYEAGYSTLGMEFTTTVSSRQTNFFDPKISTGNVKLMLFACSSTGGTPLYQFRGRMYSFKAYSNNTLIGDFVPCYRKSDNVVGMYDTVNNKFYTNAGTGNFIKGPDLNDYQYVEYIEATGTQYIDTGIKFNSNIDKFELTYQASDVEYNSGNYFIAGSGWSETGYIWVYSYPNGGWFNVYINDTSGTQRCINGFQGPDTLKHLVIYDAKKLYVDNNLTDDKSSYIFGETPHNFTLFQSIGSPERYSSKAKIYSFKMWKEGILVRNMIPCYRKSDNVIGMYDTVNGIFYANAGTGTFTKGPNV